MDNYNPGDYITYLDPTTGIIYVGTVKSITSHDNTCRLVLKADQGIAEVVTNIDNIRPLQVEFTAG